MIAGLVYFLSLFLSNLFMIQYLTLCIVFHSLFFSSFYYYYYYYYYYSSAADKSGTSDDVTDRILSEYDERVIRAVQRAYDIFDVSNRNEIQSVELERVLCSLGQSVSMDCIADLIFEMDPKNTGMLGFNNFITYVIPYLRGGYSQAAVLTLDRLKAFFDKLDLNGDGTLTPHEFKHVVNSSKNESTRLTEEEADEIVEYLDVDKDGTISWVEFSSVFKVLDDDTQLSELPGPVARALRKVRTYPYPYYTPAIPLTYLTPVNTYDGAVQC